MTPLRISHTTHGWRHEVVWFAEGEYSPARFTADSTYLRQHRLRLPTEVVVRDEPFDTLQLDLTRELDHLLRGTSRTVRYHLHRTTRDSITVRGDESEASLSLLISHQADFNQRKHLGEPPSAALLASHRGHYLLYTAHQREVWLGHVLMVHDGRRCRMWALASNLDHPDRALIGRASRAMVWHSICDAKARGMSVYDFGGIVLDETAPAYGITLFKQAFGGQHVREWNSLIIPGAVRRALYRWARCLR